MEQPIAYASRALTQAESNYSQLDREALAIIYATTYFFNYVFGRHFLLVTDNEPLSRIFHPDRPLPQMTSARLLRYASFLSGLDYSVRCKKAKENENVDCLSRVPISPPKSAPAIAANAEVNALHSETLLQISSSAITAVTIAEETAKDSELQALMKELMNNPKDSPFTINNKMLFRLDRAVIPKSLQPQILEELHATHLGITKMKQLARRYVYWERLDKDIERLVKRCEACAKVRHDPPKVEVHPWYLPEENWERVHIDYAGPFENHYFLMCVDAKSKWAEVRMLRNAPSSTSTIVLLQNIFSTHGYPLVLVSDNAAIFKSEEFQNYCKDRGIFQKCIAPNHPATNGLAERSIQTLKRKLKAAAEEPTPLPIKLQNILFRYRATPLASGLSPAELYLKRRIRIRLDALHPNTKARVRSTSNPRRVRSIPEGARVQVRVQHGNQKAWQFGTVIKKLGHCHYVIKLDSGRNVKRHINQLLSSLVPRKLVTFAPGHNPPRIREIPMIAEPPASDSPGSLHTGSAPMGNFASDGYSQQDVQEPSSYESETPRIRRSSRQRVPPRYLSDFDLRKME